MATPPPPAISKPPSFSSPKPALPSTMATPPPPPPPALMDELIEECLLRLPPDDPANFVRAALVCKGWQRIIADRGFGRRFRELHGRPPMLGFLHIQTRYGTSLFTPTSSSCLHDVNAYLRLGGWHAMDSRHGRVLLSRSPSLHSINNTRTCSDLAVWDPVTGDHLDLPKLPQPQMLFGEFNSKAAVLCASSSACDHLSCHREHFLVVLMDMDYHEVAVYIYSSQSGAWSHQTLAAQDVNRPGNLVHRQPVTMAGNALYFIVNGSANNGILKYDMGAHAVSCLDLPLDCPSTSFQIFLTTTEQGGLGIARMEVNSRRLHLWSREAGSNGVFGWAPSGVIELETVLPANTSSISTVSFLHGLCAFFMMTNNGAFAVDLLSNRVSRVASGNSHVNYLVPYTSFCTPGLLKEEDKEAWSQAIEATLLFAVNLLYEDHRGDAEQE